MASNMSEYRNQVSAALERFEKTLRSTNEKALAGQVGVTSSDGEVRIEVGGDLRLRKIALRPGTLRQYDHVELAETITRTYNEALGVMRQAQWRLYRETFRASLKNDGEHR